jgi:hypothetical protein
MELEYILYEELGYLGGGIGVGEGGEMAIFGQPVHHYKNYRMALG